MSLLSQLLEIALDDPKLTGSSHPAFVSAALEGVELQPAPIEPSWIVSGDPQATGALHSQSADGCSTTTVWRCTAGAFRWNFLWDETVYLVSGSVTVTDEAGVKTTISAGDVAYFAAGTWFTWEIADHVKKVAFCRKPFPGPIVKAMKAKRRLAGLLGRRGAAAPAAGAGLAVATAKTR